VESIEGKMASNRKQSTLKSLRLRRATDGKVKLIREAFRVSLRLPLAEDSSPANILKAARRELEGAFPEISLCKQRRELFSLVDRRYRWSTGN